MSINVQYMNDRIVIEVGGSLPCLGGEGCLVTVTRALDAVPWPRTLLARHSYSPASSSFTHLILNVERRLHRSRQTNKQTNKKWIEINKPIDGTENKNKTKTKKEGKKVKWNERTKASSSTPTLKFRPSNNSGNNINNEVCTIAGTNIETFCGNQ